MDNSSFKSNPESLHGSIPMDFLADLSRTLIYSEWHLIVFMDWVPEGKTPPSDLSKYGHMEFGIMLFLLNYPSHITDEDIQLAIEGLGLIMKFPPTNITESEFESLKNSRDVYVDGSIVATSPYALYDQNWIIALYNFILTIGEGAVYKYPGIPLPQYSTPIVVEPWSPSNTRFTVAMLADWGTGSAAALTNLNWALTKVPDCIIHLGDVYYSGSPESSADLPGYIHAGEESQNFLSLWPTGWAGRSFTLNSNHEMYCGANGLFQNILTSSSPFYKQGPTTMFAIAVGDWTLLGLDSSYYADPVGLFMYGSLAPDSAATSDQITWIQSLKLDPAKTIVLTHHNGLDFNCVAENQETYFAGFWSQVSGALGGDPYAWYWGHLHLGIAYTKPVTINYVGSTFSTNTYCRCLGNGSMPYGTPTELVTGASPNIEWFTGQGSPVQELQNGFVFLDFEFNGDKVSQISEVFYLGATGVYNKTIFNP